MTQVEGCCKDVTRVLQITRIRMLQGCYQHIDIKVFVEMLNKYWSDAPQYFADIAGLMYMYMQ